MKCNNLRPKNLNEFIGKSEIKNNLKVFIASALKQKQPLDHCLFYGPAGTGKTSLAFIIAKEMNAHIKIVQGSNIQKPADIISILSTICENDILFIDEIHSINKSCSELLYSAMEDFNLDIVVGKDFNAKPVRIKMANFTVIGATTLLGNITDALETRFGIVFKIDLYDNDEIVAIVKNTCNLFNLKLQEKDINKIALSSKGIPRTAIRIVKRVFDYFNQNKNIELSDILTKLGINEYGLNKVDIKYLQTIYNFKNVAIGIKTISQALNEDIKTIELKIEPYLIKNGLILKTQKGRLISEKGIKIINNNKI